MSNQQLIFLVSVCEGSDQSNMTVSGGLKITPQDGSGRILRPDSGSAIRQIRKTIPPTGYPNWGGSI